MRRSSMLIEYAANIDIKSMLTQVEIRKDEQEEMEAAEYIDKHIIPNLPPGFGDGENI